MQIYDLVPDLRPTILAARQVRDARNTLERFLPVRAVNDVSYRLGRKRRMDQTVPVRAIDAPATPIRRPGVVDVKGDLPAVTPIVNLTEDDLTREMIMARQLNGLAVDWQDPVDDGATQVALAADNTFELMRGQVLSTGTISLVADDGDLHSVDFGVPGGQIITAASAWNGAGSGNVFKDFDAAHEVFAAAYGNGAGIALTTRRVAATMLNAVQALFPNSPVGQNELSAYLANRGLPQIVTYDRVLVSATGARSRVYPEGTITFLPGDEDPVGRTELGITQEAVQQVTRRQPNGGTALLANEVAGLTIVTLGQDNPVQRAVKGAAIGMPVLADTDAITVLKGVLS
ncbi:major capsid protein [Nocardioides campestrisoli]|uniref:major capsid protein n=1 Tax=Nocardioides campestrisoli TaxID=2736757 RepID=UPI0015E63876|nr:major capsid protein [Nocardioides campestrisoli]